MARYEEATGSEVHSNDPVLFPPRESVIKSVRRILLRTSLGQAGPPAKMSISRQLWSSVASRRQSMPLRPESGKIRGEVNGSLSRSGVNDAVS